MATDAGMTFSPLQHSSATGNLTDRFNYYYQLRRDRYAGVERERVRYAGT